jgi:hypothetical protein
MLRACPVCHLPTPGFQICVFMVELFLQASFSNDSFSKKFHRCAELSKG